MAHQKINNPRLAEMVTKQLKDSIFSGEYPPGERIPSEHELVEAFGVSRVIVREAVRDLERSGLIRVKRGPKGGAVVQSMRHEAVTAVMRDMLHMGQASVSDLWEVRMEIEPIVAGLAALRAEKSDIEHIRRHLASPPKFPSDEYVLWNSDFHRLVAAAAHNQIYNILVNILQDFAEEMILRLRPFDRTLHGLHWHPTILDLIEKGDAEGARSVFREHLEVYLPLMEELETPLLDFLHS
jgi:DNA-binding FadR family transcriptional regulator